MCAGVLAAVLAFELQPSSRASISRCRLPVAGRSTLIRKGGELTYELDDHFTKSRLYLDYPLRAFDRVGVRSLSYVGGRRTGPQLSFL